MNKATETKVKDELKKAANGQNGIFTAKVYGEIYSGKVYAGGNRVTDIQYVGDADDIDEPIPAMPDEVADAYEGMTDEELGAEPVKETYQTKQIDAAKESGEKLLAEGKTDYVLDPEDDKRVLMICTCCGRTFSQSKFTKYQTLCPDCRYDTNLLSDKHREVLDHLLANEEDTVMNMAATFDRHPSSIAGTLTFLAGHGLAQGADGYWFATKRGDTWFANGRK